MDNNDDPNTVEVYHETGNRRHIFPSAEVDPSRSSDIVSFESSPSISPNSGTLSAIPTPPKMTDHVMTPDQSDSPRPGTSKSRIISDNSRNRHYGTMEIYSASDPGRYDGLVSRPLSAPDGVIRQTTEGGSDDDMEQEDEDYSYGYVPGMNVQITPSENRLPTQRLPEGLRHVMLHVIGSRPSEEVKFRRLKYKLESENLQPPQDGPFMPRGPKQHRAAPSLARQQSRKTAARPTALRQISRESYGELPSSRLSESTGGRAPIEDLRTESIVSIETRRRGILIGSSGRQKTVLVILALNELLSSMALSVLAPFFPKEARVRGITEAVSGWVFGVFALVQCISSPFFGKYLPQLGAKFLSQAGIFFAGGCTALFGALQYLPNDASGPMVFLVLCFVLRVFMALGCAANATAAFAIAARTFPDNPATVFGLLETAVGFGLMMGPAIGGVLYEVGGFVAPFAAIGSLMVLSIPVGIWVLPRESELFQEEAPPLRNAASVREFLSIPAITITSMAAFVACLVWVMPDPTLEPHLASVRHLYHTLPV